MKKLRLVYHHQDAAHVYDALLFHFSAEYFQREGWRLYTSRAGFFWNVAQPPDHKAELVRSNAESLLPRILSIAPCDGDEAVLVVRGKSLVFKSCSSAEFPATVTVNFEADENSPQAVALCSALEECVP